MSSPNPRKRPAPGAAPVGPYQQIPQQYVPNTQMLQWNGAAANGSNFVDASAAGVNQYGMVPQGQMSPNYPSQPSSNALTRIPANRALVPSANRGNFETGNDLWNYSDDTALIQPTTGTVDEHDNIEILEEKAQRAKREAQAKRKQIPPFVQKLSSFLDESKNTDLIRWSDKGDSFIVLDEDEFAKTLIPELFKHNNYASFVRQLNMYGFHKRVGLSDNSMKASERKNKSPSEYYNPYFKRGHPNLLWLINKPKSGSSKKKGKKEDGDVDSDEENIIEEIPTAPYGVPAPQPGRALPQADVGPLQRRELTAVREQISQLQQQQKNISNIIQRLRGEHNQMLQQAIMFQNMHDRHENSINAILNFLANVFRKSLEDQGGNQNVAELLASILPTSQIPQGSVLDLGDFHQQTPSPAAMSPGKRQQRLLPPIPGRANTVVSTPGSNAGTASYNPAHHAPMGQVTEIFDNSPADTTSPNQIKHDLQANPQESMMKLIHETNAGNSPAIDMPEVVANTNVTLSDDQRNGLLNAFGAQNATPSHTTPAPAIATSATSVPAIPSIPDGRQPSNSISPTLRQNVLPPSIDHLNFNAEQLEELARLTEQSAKGIHDLQASLTPLSPSGRIPGLDADGNTDGSYFQDNGDLDYNDYLNNYLPGDDIGLFGGADPLGAPDGSDMFGTPPLGYAQDPGQAPGIDADGLPAQVENNTPSPTPTEEITRDDMESPVRDLKRQRRG